jgi:hypothetical protein
MKNPIEKHTGKWKRLVKQHIKIYWEEAWLEEKQTKSTLKFLNLQQPLFGNGIIIFVLMKYIYIRTHCDILILNLTSADLFVGLVLLLQSISCLNIEFNILSDVCIFRFSSMVLVSFASLFAVLNKITDKFLTIAGYFDYYNFCVTVC